MTHPAFTAAEWEKAPEYTGPGLRELHRHANTTILDFESLQMIAALQEEAGAFRSPSGLDTLKAPIKLGEVPAAFVKVVSLNEDDYLVHRPQEPEILVVLDGILSLRSSRRARIFSSGTDRPDILRSGDVVALGSEGVQLTAHGLSREAASLALAILGINPAQAELILMSSRTYTDKLTPQPARQKLYENDDYDNLC